MTTLAVENPELAYPGLPDGMAWDVAALVAGAAAFDRHFNSVGCSTPYHPAVPTFALGGVAAAVEAAHDWPFDLRERVLYALALVQGS